MFVLIETLLDVFLGAFHGLFKRGLGIWITVLCPAFIYFAVGKASDWFGFVNSSRIKADNVISIGDIWAKDVLGVIGVIHA
ncbi:unannotated protein [freshwater metagenome]|uniref:Unannotated protein n=1 Tax=freshwater metagenome TaxID=449393 RepID=A0A6J6FS19_9ZZZZ